MVRKLMAAILVAGLAFSFAGCKKKEEKPQLPPGHPSMEGMMSPAGAQKPVERTINVPKDVRTKWKAVKLTIEDKAKKSSKDYEVSVGSELAVPNTQVVVKVLNFLPHFMMTDKEITSVSNEPKMPAAQVVVTENGKEIWKGWLFSMQPEMHPFSHEKVGIKLAGGVAK